MAVYFILKNNDSSPIFEEENFKEEKIQKENQDVLEKFQKSVFAPVREIDEGDYIWGDANAPVKIIIYSDFACPFCLLFTDTIEKIKKEFDEKIVIAYRHFSLLTDSNSVPAAQASECAGEQGKFWEMHDRLFIDNKEERMATAQFKTDAQDLGLDMNKFNSCMDEKKYIEKIENQIKEARDYGVLGTPSIFVNERLLAGAYPFRNFRDSAGKDRQGMKNIIKELLK